MPKTFKTVAGEVYARCGLTFGPQPTEVGDKELATVTHRDGVKQTVGERLALDPSLVEVTAAKADSKPESLDAGKPTKAGK